MEKIIPLNSLIEELEKDINKFKNEINKKYENLIIIINNILITLNKLKTNSQNNEKFNEILNKENNNFIELINLIIKSKKIKYFNFLIPFIKKLIEYKFISKENISILIKNINEIFDILTQDEQKIKIIEIIQLIILSSNFIVNKEIINNLFNISFQGFNKKNIIFKNPIRLLFTTLIDKIVKSKENDLIILTLNIFLEIINNKKKAENNIYKLCLAFELSYQIL